jgi:anti-sigma-K factor RskA
MKYSPATIERLAGEYVLGTLRGPARQRFERLCAQDAAVRAARDAWERRLAELAERAAPIAPSPQVWSSILGRLGLSPARGQPRRPRWQQFAVAASLALLAGALGWYMAQDRAFRPVLSAVVTGEGGRPLWRVAASGDASRLQITVLGGETIPDDRSLELWAVPRNGGAPVSLGLIPRAQAVSVALQETQRAALLGSDKVAVSLEPRGGSPTGVATGPVVHVADLSRNQG